MPAATRLVNDYRDYDGRAVAVVKFIGRARSLGFRLSEVATHLRSPKGEGRKARLQAQLEAKLCELDAHMKEVRVRRAMIAGLVEEVREARGGRR